MAFIVRLALKKAEALNDVVILSQEKEAFVVSQLAGKGLTLRDVDGEDMQAFLPAGPSGFLEKSWMETDQKDLPAICC